MSFWEFLGASGSLLEPLGAFGNHPYPFWLKLQKSLTNPCPFGNRSCLIRRQHDLFNQLPYIHKYCTAKPPIGFTVLTTSSSSSEPLKSYIDQRHLQRCDVKVFLVETEAMAWYMGVFAATSEQCSNPYQQKHLCIVACQHESSRKLHAVSQILFLPQFHLHRYSHLTQLDCLLRKHPVLAKAVAKFHEIAARQGHAPQEG